MPKQLPNRSFFMLEKPEGFHPVNDSIGVIRHIALCFYSGKNEALRNSYNKVYFDLIRKLVQGTAAAPEQLEISVIVPSDDTLEEIKEVHRAIHTLVRFTNSYLSPQSLATYNLMPADRSKLSLWIQDYFISLQNKNDIRPGIRLVEDRKRSRTNGDQANSLDKYFSKKHLGQDSILIKSQLDFKGGNILFIGKYVLIGKDTLNGIPQQEFEEQFQKITGIAPEQIIWLGDDSPILKPNLGKTWEGEEFNWIDSQSCQPIYHLDLFITPAGKDEFGRYRLLIGNPIYKGKQNLPIFRYSAEQIEMLVSHLENYSDLVIYRNPLPLSFADSTDKNGKKRRVWFFASYNNCLVQWDTNPHNCCVWLPSYGYDSSNEWCGYKRAGEHDKYGRNRPDLKEYDEANEQLWRSLGFEVIKLTNYLPLAVNRGAVRCITKVLYRNQLSTAS